MATLPPSTVTTVGNQTALGNFALQVIKALQKDDVANAGKKLNAAIERTDGSTLRGAPDAGGGGRNPPVKYYIKDCAQQAEIYFLLVEALDALAP